MPRHIRSAWLKTLATVAAVLLFSGLVGWFTGHLWLCIALGALATLTWHYWRLRSVLRRLTARQRSRLIAFVTNSNHPHGVRVALASEYSMEQLVTGGGYAQSNNMLLQKQMQLQHAMMARQTPPQIQLTPGLSGGMGSMHFQTPTQGNAQRTLMNGGSTGFSFPGKKG